MIPALLPTYARNELAFDRGEGAYLFATNGRKYLDFASGIAVKFVTPKKRALHPWPLCLLWNPPRAKRNSSSGKS